MPNCFKIKHCHTKSLRRLKRTWVYFITVLITTWENAARQMLSAKLAFKMTHILSLLINYSNHVRNVFEKTLKPADYFSCQTALCWLTLHCTWGGARSLCTVRVHEYVYFPFSFFHKFPHLSVGIFKVLVKIYQHFSANVSWYTHFCKANSPKWFLCYFQ